MNLIEKEEERFEVLKHVYQISNASTFPAFELDELATGLNYEYEKISRIVEYLVEENLLSYFSISKLVRITHSGIKEIEQATREPQNRTEHFPANITYNISNSNITNSSIQQGSGNTSILKLLSKDEIPELENILEQLEQVKNFQGLAVEAFQELGGEIDVLRSLSKLPKPKLSMITESLKSIRTLVENVAATAISEKLLPAIDHLIQNHQ